ncbi:hypothetical protein ElyMa_002080900 [Elysia marginata]|uniref:HTH CENPB-type domain-containing protein n=1 Tax=Elysia marginata TaxID=1093978 RepID=A0AAV4FBL3_9GAST|nr:hypothetical protein ElyMa_002080900 [Elysia marginata]
MIDLRTAVKRVLDVTVAKFKDNVPGHDWALRFMKRHSERVKNRMCQNITKKRVPVDLPELDSIGHDQASLTMCAFTIGSIPSLSCTVQHIQEKDLIGDNLSSHFSNQIIIEYEENNIDRKCGIHPLDQPSLKPSSQTPQRVSCRD